MKCGSLNYGVGINDSSAAGRHVPVNSTQSKSYKKKKKTLLHLEMEMGGNNNKTNTKNKYIRLTPEHSQRTAVHTVCTLAQTLDLWCWQMDNFKKRRRNRTVINRSEIMNQFQSAFDWVVLSARLCFCCGKKVNFEILLTQRKNKNKKKKYNS